MNMVYSGLTPAGSCYRNGEISTFSFQLLVSVNSSAWGEMCQEEGLSHQYWPVTNSRVLGAPHHRLSKEKPF